MSEVPQNDWLERLSRFNLQFGRFLRDAIGVALIAFAVMSLLAIWKITEGALLTPFASLLTIWFGWGSFIIIAAIGYFGYSLLQQERTSSVQRPAWTEAASVGDLLLWHRKPSARFGARLCSLFSGRFQS